MGKRSDEIARLIAGEDWEGARRLVERELHRHPDNHWLLDRLSLTYYEQRDYETALAHSMQAMEIAPDCPLVQWEVAGALDMLQRGREAIDVYERITGRTLDDLAQGRCGEGLGWARGLLADTYYRLGTVHEKLNESELAADMYRRAVKNRGRNVTSIYSHKTLQEALVRVEAACKRQ